jgi:hypothetical protein
MNDASYHMHLSEDADQKAIEDLTKQVKGARGPMASIIRARRDQLKIEVEAERGFVLALAKARKSLVELMTMASVSADPELFMSFTDEQILDLILRGGLGLAIDDFVEATTRIRASVEKSLEAVGVDLSPQAIPQLDLIQQQATTAVFEDVILPDFTKAIKTALRSMSLEIPVEIIKSDLELQLERATGRQLTDIKTQISEYGRSTTAIASAAAGLEHYLYTGPRDGITRPFCDVLINLVVDEKQMNKLNNNQGRPVRIACGGYNCRHSWSPITESFIEAAGLERATSGDIVAANAAAKRKRR